MPIYISNVKTNLIEKYTLKNIYYLNHFVKFVKSVSKNSDRAFCIIPPLIISLPLGSMIALNSTLFF